MLKIKTVLVEKMWGGTNLKKYNFDLPSEKTGEAWLISGFKGYESKIENKDLNLSEYYKKNHDKFNNFNSEEFPLLVKIIDANDKLSVQVHPDNKLAQELDDYPFGKSEAWYIIDHKPNAKIIVGSKTKNKEELISAIKKRDWNNVYNVINSVKHIALNIDAGTIHAILEGNLIYEVQQSSNLTYRMYDFDRLENNKPRELHIEKSIKSVTTNNNIQQLPKTIIDNSELNITQIINNSFFILEKWIMKDKTSVKLDVNGRNFLLVSNLENLEVEINSMILRKGESLIIEADDLNDKVILTKGELLVSYPK